MPNAPLSLKVLSTNSLGCHRAVDAKMKPIIMAQECLIPKGHDISASRLRGKSVFPRDLSTP